MPDSFKHVVERLGGGQETKERCWLASYRMLYRYKGLPVNSIEDKLRGAGIDVEDAMKNGLVDKDYAKAATALGFQMWSGTQYKEQNWYNISLFTGTQNFLELLAEGPLWVSRWVDPGYHAVVATGYNDTGKGYIIYNNPFPGPDNARENPDTTANNFCKFITDAKGSVQRI